MIRALVAKSMGDAKLLFVALLFVMLLFPWLFIWTSSKISLPAFSDFLTHALPQQWQRVWGVPFSQVATPAGRIALVYVHPLVVFGTLVWAVARGSDCVSGEIGRGTMEMLIAQPVRRTSVYFTQAAVTILGSAALAAALWTGTAVGLATVPMSERVSSTLFLPPALNLFCMMICLGGAAALVSSFDSQRWRTVGIIGAWYALSTLSAIAGGIADGWKWLSYISIVSAFKPQSMVALPDQAWSLLAYRDGHVAAIGLEGMSVVLMGIGALCYLAGAVVFNRREIPAPL